MAPPRPSSRVLRSRSESVLDALTRRPCERHRGNRIGWLGPKASPAAPSVQRALPRPQPRVDPGGCPPGLLGECVLARSRRHRRCSSCSVDHASESVRLVACASRQPSRVARSNLAVRRTNPAPAGRGRGVPCGLDRVPLARPTTSSRSARSRRRTVPFGPAPRSGSVARRRCCHPLRRGLEAATASVCFVAWSLACAAHHKCASALASALLASISPRWRRTSCVRVLGLQVARVSLEEPVNAGSFSRCGCGHPSSIGPSGLRPWLERTSASSLGRSLVAAPKCVAALPPALLASSSLRSRSRHSPHPGRPPFARLAPRAGCSSACECHPTSPLLLES